MLMHTLINVATSLIFSTMCRNMLHYISTIHYHYYCCCRWRLTQKPTVLHLYPETALLWMTGIKYIYTHGEKVRKGEHYWASWFSLYTPMTTSYYFFYTSVVLYVLLHLVSTMISWMCQYACYYCFFSAM